MPKTWSTKSWRVASSCAALLATSVPALTCAQDAATLEAVTRYARYGADVWAANELAKLTGEGEACVSCHTSLPYALVEPVLPGDYPAYTDLIGNVNERIRTWSQNTAWYADDKRPRMAAFGGLPPDAFEGLLNGPDARGSEAVLNALIRATHDAYAGLPAQAETRLAFEHMWAEQVKVGPTAGRWNWIRANLIPWEVADSDLWGASLACVAASIFDALAPQQNLDLLHATLEAGAASPDVSLHAKAAILWCDAETGGQVLDDSLAIAIEDALLAEQRQNGAWALRDLGPWVGWAGSDSDCCAMREVRPDAYATGFVTLALARRAAAVGSERLAGPLADAMAWIDPVLADPFPAEPRYNRHSSAEVELPKFRNHLYTNAGHMWAFLARTAYARQAAPWRAK